MINIKKCIKCKWASDICNNKENVNYNTYILDIKKCKKLKERLFNKGESVVILDGEYENFTGTIGGSEYIDTKNYYYVWFDNPVVQNEKFVLNELIHSLQIDHYSGIIKNSLNCWRDWNQESLRNRFIKYLKATKLTQNFIADELGVDYKSLNAFKNDTDGFDYSMYRKKSLLFPDNYVKLYKYLEKKGY